MDQNNSQEKVIPPRLFHYTNIDTLAYILKTKKLKFNRLDKLDDTTEGLTQDTENAGKYFFVSSWTSLEEENLAFWSMYTNNMQGIRIEMKPYPFLYLLNVDKWVGHQEYIEYKNGEGPHYLPLIEEIKGDVLADNRHLIFFNPVDKFLDNIVYTNDEDKLKPNYFTSIGAFRTNNIGKYKKEVWAFQKEWRYRLHYTNNKYYGYSGSLENIQKVIDHAKQRGTHKELIEKDIPDFTYKMMRLSDEALLDMKIVIGPKCTEADEIIINSLLKSFDLEGKVEVRWSSLKGSIR